MPQKITRSLYAAAIGLTTSAVGLAWFGVDLVASAKFEDLAIRTQRTRANQSCQSIPVECVSCDARAHLAGDLLGASTIMALLAVVCVAIGYVGTRWLKDKTNPPVG
jgi:hypothetical protein